MNRIPPIPESFRPPRGRRFLASLPVLALICFGSQVSAETSLPFVIVSAGDSVASGEGSPDVPREYGFNEDFNPMPFRPNPDFDTSPLSVNPNFDPSPGTLNESFDPFPQRVNPSFQPFPAPPEWLRVAIAAAGLPALPPQNTTLVGPNPNYSPTLVFGNPNFDPNPVQTNPDFDPVPWSSDPNPDFQPNPWALKREAEWESEDDHRSKWAGPAQAAQELMRRNPNLNIKFEHRAKSGGSIAAVGEQVQAALDANGGRIDILMISAGGNDIHEDGFSGLIQEVLSTIFDDFMRPSRDPALNAQIARNIAAMEGKFDELADIIAAGSVGEVFITEYFNFTQDEEGFYTFEEADWIHQSIILPLNGAIAAAARKHGWHYVGGIAGAFDGHGFKPSETFELESPFLVNPNYDPIENYPNRQYDPLPEKINLNYNPIEEIPNLNYNPIEAYPNLSYDPNRTKLNPSYDPIEKVPCGDLGRLCNNPNYDPRFIVNGFLNPKYDPVEKIPCVGLCDNPNYDPRFTIPNPDYDPDLLTPNPGYDPDFLKPNPDYDPRVTVPNPAYDPRLTFPNRNFSPELIVPTPHYLPPWVTGVKYGEPLPPTQPNHHWVVHLEESLLVQGDIQGTLHPNYWGQAVYRDALLRVIGQVMPELQAAPGGAPAITSVESRGSMVRLHFAANADVAQLYVESSRLLATWQIEDVTPVMTEAGKGYIDVPKSGARAKYFRIGCR